MKIYLLSIIFLLISNNIFAEFLFEKNSALVTDIKGSAEISKNNGAWKNLSKNMLIEVNDKIKTSKNSELKIEFIDKSYIFFEDKSIIRIDEIEINEKKIGNDSEIIKVIRIFLEEGTINGDIKKYNVESKINITTPNAFCDVRGALFNLTYKKDSTLKVINGVVDLYRINNDKSNNNIYNLTDLQKATISSDINNMPVVIKCDNNDIKIANETAKNKTINRPEIISSNCNFFKAASQGAEFDFDINIKTEDSNFKIYIVLYDENNNEKDYFQMQKSDTKKDNVYQFSKRISLSDIKNIKYRFMVEYD